MEELERHVACPGCLARFPVAEKGYKLCNITNDRWLDYDGLLYKTVSASMLVSAEGQVLVLHRRALRPTVAIVFGRELGWQVYDELYSETGGFPRSEMLPPPRVYLAPTSRAQHRQYEPLDLGMWGIDETKGLIPKGGDSGRKSNFSDVPRSKYFYTKLTESMIWAIGLMMIFRCFEAIARDWSSGDCAIEYMSLRC